VENIQIKGYRAWLSAARPKTLPAALAPVIAATALAWYDKKWKWQAALYCLGFALLAQIAANFINDYMDFKSGIDTAERLGPARAVASGWIAPRKMIAATALVWALALLCGLQLIPYTYLGWKLLWVGATSVVFCCLYSPLSHYGLGDVFVLIFFGLTPTVFTYFVQANCFSFSSILLGTMLGFLSINILISNNYRDYYTDMTARKRTSIVLFGKAFGRVFYVSMGILACLLNLWLFYVKGNFLFGFIAWLYLIPHYRAWRTMRRIDSGKELNVLLALSSVNLLFFCLLEIISFIVLRTINPFG
jgi:1,4-dihydroxy-2-naphthoate octaprenyltransferase